MSRRERATSPSHSGDRSGDAAMRGMSRNGGAEALAPATLMSKISTDGGSAWKRTPPTDTAREKKRERPPTMRARDQEGAVHKARKARVPMTRRTRARRRRRHKALRFSSVNGDEGRARFDRLALSHVDKADRSGSG